MRLTPRVQYAVAIGDGIYYREAEARCHKWARFLINHFPKEGGFDWSETLFHQWIIEKHPVWPFFSPFLVCLP